MAKWPNGKHIVQRWFEKTMEDGWIKDIQILYELYKWYINGWLKLLTLFWLWLRKYLQSWRWSNIDPFHLFPIDQWDIFMTELMINISLIAQILFDSLLVESCQGLWFEVLDYRSSVVVETVLAYFEGGWGRSAMVFVRRLFEVFGLVLLLLLILLYCLRLFIMHTNIID
jgi:hypothetical protein